MVTDLAEIDRVEEEGATTTEIIPDILIDGMVKAEEDQEGNVRFKADNVLQHGENMDQEETAPQLSSLSSTQHTQSQPHPQLLKGYEYTKFNPKSLNHSLPGESCMTPTQSACLDTLADLKKNLHRPQDTGHSYKDPQLDLWHCSQLEGMMPMLNMFMRWESCTYNHRGWSRESLLWSMVTCCSYSPQYHHIPSLLYAWEAPHTVPPGDESVLQALTHQLLTTAFLSFSLTAAVSVAMSSTLLSPTLFPVLQHMTYCLTAFISMSVTFTLSMPCLVTLPPHAICHHARKEDHLEEEEACQSETGCSIAASASIHINSNHHTIIATTSYRGEHRPCHIIARLTIGSYLEAHISGRVKGRI